MVKLLKKLRTPTPVSLKRFAETRNNILVMREVGGLGDILMHRMMFEDFKRVMPDARITWGVPPDYLQAAADHPFVDEVVDCRTVNPYDYIISYNTTTACGRYEAKVAPLSDKHRSDIWANHCGVILTRHNMHLKINPDAQEWARSKLHAAGATGKTVLLSPLSAQQGKNLTVGQMREISAYLKAKGLFVFATHTSPILELQKIGVPTLWGMGIKHWMALVAAADYVVSVDTSTFHCAGGLGRPLTGIFTYIDGLTYSKYYPTAIIVQKHRLLDPSWDCGPCFNWHNCPKCPAQNPIKPCLTDISTAMLVDGIEIMLQNRMTTLA